MRALLLSFVVGISNSAMDGPTPAGERWHPMDFVTQEVAGGFELSPNGQRVVWERTQTDLEAQRARTQLQLADLATGETIPLTQGDHDAGSAKWSPNGRLIAFLTDRPNPKTKGEEPEGPQIWLIRASGGEAWPLTRLNRGVSNFGWSGDDGIVFTASEDPALFENELKERKDTSAVIDDESHTPPIRLFGVAVETGEVARLTTNSDRIVSISVSPDGKWAFATHEQSLRFGYDQKIRPKYFLWNLETLEAKPLFSDGKTYVSSAEWEPDSSGFFFTRDYSTHPTYLMATEARLGHFDLAAGKPEEIPGGQGVLFGIFEPGVDSALAIMENGIRSRLAKFTQRDGKWVREEVAGEHVSNTWGIELSADGRRLLYAHSTASKPEQWFVAGFEGASITESRRFTELNEELAGKTFARTEGFRWKGAKDEEVEGVLYYPLNYEAGKRYPLVLMIHGGPTYHDPDAWNDSSSYPAHLFAQEGAFVLMPNYHGSTGYGLAFTESIADGGYYTLPLEDLRNGVAALIARGLVDEDKLGTLGWSNGAILSTALIVKDPRFKAASSGAGGSFWVDDWGVCAFGQAFSNYYLGRAPIEDIQRYLQNAPLLEFDKIRTPTIFFHGTEDFAVPTFHGLSQYRTLQYLGKVETKLVLFPGEPHGLSKPAHNLRKVEEELFWFRKHLFGTSPKEPRNEALMEGSALADAIAKLTAKRQGRLYGEVHTGTLVPEVVDFAGLKIGRFEVTRAQFKAFDPSYRFEDGTDNYPASGISLERAKAYCAWLSQKTGRVYRLPNEEESDRLHGAAGPAENTLDAWAGYPVNPDDFKRLSEVVKKLAGTAPLLREVGLYSGVGAGDKVYDLGGNVAEWVVPNDGDPYPAGGSADAPEDPKSDIGPTPEYVGLRVVLASSAK